MAVHTPTKLMYDVMMTAYNCYITVIFKSFQNTFIKMHQNVNINTFFFRHVSSLFISYGNEISRRFQGNLLETSLEILNKKYIYIIRI